MPRFEDTAGEKATVMYDIRKLVERNGGVSGILDRIGERIKEVEKAKGVDISFGGGIMADHLIAVTTPEEYRYLKQIIDELLAEDSETERATDK